MLFANTLQKNISVVFWLNEMNASIFASQIKLLIMLRNRLHIDTKWFSPMSYNRCGACISTN